jgi:exonuclease III
MVTAASKDENSVLIASMLPCNNEFYPDADPIFAHNILSVHFAAFSICGVYLPHKKKHNLFDYLIEKIISQDRIYIVTGDFNSGKNKIDQEGTSFWYEDKLIKLEANEYVDAFRLLHGDVKEYSWFSHQGNGYRYDHTYVHQDLIPIVKQCHYIHDWREQKLSDHSPMWIQIG